MGRLFVVNLEGKIYSCKYCRTHLALTEDIVSKSFHSRHGKAYLFNKVVNTTLGETEDRLMMTGMHTVADIFCVGCGSIVGWKYESAHEKSQKYKEGKSVLERTSVDQRLYFMCYEPNDCMFILLNPCKVFGPDGSNYWVAREARIGESDSDDV